MKQQIQIHESKEKIFCSYCKGSIEENEAYIVEKNEIYHLSCWKQINTYSPSDYLNEQED